MVIPFGTTFRVFTLIAMRTKLVPYMVEKSPRPQLREDFLNTKSDENPWLTDKLYTLLPRANCFNTTKVPVGDRQTRNGPELQLPINTHSHTIRSKLIEVGYIEM